MNQESFDCDAEMTSDISAMAREDMVEGRPARIPIGSGGALEIPESIKEEIEAKGCIRRFFVDDDRGNIQKALNAYWEPYVDGNGKQYRINAGRGEEMILMMLLKRYAEEDKKLRKRQNTDKLAAHTRIDTSGDVPDYLPEGREHVIENESLTR